MKLKRFHERTKQQRLRWAVILALVVFATVMLFINRLERSANPPTVSQEDRSQNPLPVGPDADSEKSSR